MIIGIAGKIASGKDRVTQIFKDHNFIEINVDKIGHDALLDLDIKNQLVNIFSDKILDNNNNIDRKMLANIVFSHPLNLKKLENITHPYIRKCVKEQIYHNQNQNIIINCALLFPLQLHHYTDKIIWVKSCFYLRLYRLQKRNNLTYQEAKKRIVNQSHLHYYPYKKRIKVIKNNNSLNSLKNKVNKYFYKV